jgi:HK97 family phage major capsid protein
MARPIQQLWNELEALQNRQAEELRLHADAEAGSEEAASHLDEAHRCEGGIEQLMATIRERTVDEDSARANAAASAGQAPRAASFGEQILGARNEFRGVELGFKNTATVLHTGRPTEVDLELPAQLPGLFGGFAATLQEVPMSAGAVTYKRRGTQTGHASTWGGVTPETGTTNGNSAAKQMVLFDWVDVTATAETIAGYVPVSKQSLRDYDTLMSIIESDLLIDLNEQTDAKYLNGNSQNGIVGIHNTTGIQIFSTGVGGLYYDAIRKMRTLVMQNARRIPTHVCVAPAIKEAIDLYKTTTNLYQTIGDGNKYWGMEIVEDFNEAGIMVYDNRAAKRRSVLGTTVEVGYVNDQFIKNELCLLAEHDKALQVMYPNAFCTATKAALDAAAA